jgi:ketosteroid isomerase-like protein
MPTTAVMTTQDVANRFHELAQKGQWDQIQEELFAGNAESVEPQDSPGLKSVKGLDAIRKKGKEFQDAVQEVHGGYSSEPQVAGNYFSVAMGMDVTMKGQGRVKMDEIAVYKVRDGKIVKEEFFY